MEVSAWIMLLACMPVGADGGLSIALREFEIVDDPGQPLVVRMDAAERVAVASKSNREVCEELARRIGPDPVGSWIDTLLWPNHPCRREWGESVAETAVEGQDIERIMLFHWLSCDYLEAHPDVVSKVIESGHSRSSYLLGVRSSQCGLAMYALAIAESRKAVPPIIRYDAADGSSVLLQQADGEIEAIDGGERVVVLSRDSNGGLYTLYLTLAGKDGNTNASGVMRVSSQESPRVCDSIGRFESGSASIESGDRVTLLSMDITFSVSTCSNSDDVQTTARLRAEELELWRVRGLLDYVAVEKMSPELADELRIWGQDTPVKPTSDSER